MKNHNQEITKIKAETKTVLSKNDPRGVKTARNSW